MNTTQSRNSFVFFKRKRKGNVLQQVVEKYYRIESDFGFIRGKQISFADLLRIIQNSAQPTLLVLDTNILLHHIDILESTCPLFTNIVVLETVLH